MKLFFSLTLVFVTCSCLRNFKIIQENVKVEIKAPDIIEDASIFIRKLNRTFDGLNSTATFKVDLNDSIFITAKSYEKRGNKYHPSIMDTKLDFCAFLKNPAKQSLVLALFYPTVVEHGNFPRKCPIPAGYYYIYNFNVNEEAFPPYFPIDSRWRFVMSVFHHEMPLFITTIGFRVEPKQLWD
ncbi:LOC111079382 [Sergentomyia squamirostris]